MKKLLVTLSIGATFLIGCSQSAGDKFVGTWSSVDTKDFCKYEKIKIDKNEGGSGYSVNDLHYHSNYTANLDGNTLIIDAGIIGKVPLKIESNQIEWTTMNVGHENCLLSKQNS